MFLALLLSLIPQRGAAATDPGPVPWVVLDQPDDKCDDTLVDPQLAVLPDGTLIAAYKHSDAHGGSCGLKFFRSNDRGRTWTATSVLSEPKSASLFVHDGELWLLGVDASGSSLAGTIAMRRSKDRSETWSTPSSSKEGLLQDKLGGPMTTRVVIKGGRVWRAFTKMGGRPIQHFAIVASAALDADWMQADSWSWSSPWPIEFSPYGGCLLADVPDPVGLALLMQSGTGKYTACAKVLENGAVGAAVVDSIPHVPKDACGSRLIRDASTSRTFTLVSNEFESKFPGRYFDAKNVLALETTEDFVQWKSAGVLLHDVDGLRFKFGWGDALADGEDLLVVSDLWTLADEKSDRYTSHSLVFLRVPKFRERTPSSTPLWGAPIPK